MISKIQDIPTENQISMVYFDTLKDDDTPILMIKSFTIVYKKSLSRKQTHHCAE